MRHVSLLFVFTSNDGKKELQHCKLKEEVVKSLTRVSLSFLIFIDISIRIVSIGPPKKVAI